MRPKRLMLLGGSPYLIPVIEAAHELGCYVITCDYLPDNAAHKHADEYCNRSVIDKEAVLTAAQELKIDGITSFATDPGVTTAAFVAEKLGLPFQCSYETAQILQNKVMFRRFLSTNGFNAPRSWGFDSPEQALVQSRECPYPLIVKPADAAGSKGVSRVESPTQLADAVAEAISHSITGTVICEEFIEQLGLTTDNEAFTVDGHFQAIAFIDQLFDPSGTNPYVPSAFAVPSKWSGNHRSELRQELQRLSDLLGLRNGLYNIESRIGVDGRVYIMEVSPRGGGNRLSELVRAASGMDLIKAEVCAALGLPLPSVGDPVFHSVMYQKILYSQVAGTFVGIEIDQITKDEYLDELLIWTPVGSNIAAFTSASGSVGTLRARFSSRQEIDSFREQEEYHVSVVVE